MGAVGRLVDRAGSAQVDLDAGRLRERLAGEDFFWLDLFRPNERELGALEDAFGFHPLAVEDSLHFGQRPKLEEYDEFVFLVVYGWAPDEDNLVEVHLYYSDRFLVTVHRDDAPVFAEVRARCQRTLAEAPEPILVLHNVVDGLVDSFMDPLERFNDRVQLIEDEMLARPNDRHMQDILRMRRRLARLRRTIGPQRDLFGRLVMGGADLPGMTPEAERYFRDVYDHLFRLAELIDAQRELMTGTVDVYLSATSNRLGNVTKQLTVIATIFLPLTFVTGFFGQNFGWMVEHVDSWVAFLVLGVGVQLATIAGLVVYFKRQGWF
jgi:magnesium transporter